MKYTPYIYILFLFFSQTVFSQKKKSLRIECLDENSNIIIEEIGYKKEIENDSLYRIEIKTFREKLDHKGFIQHRIDSVYQNDSLYYTRFELNNSVDTIRFTHPDIASFAKELGIRTKDSITYETSFFNTSSFINRLSEFYQNKGFPFVSIRLNNITKHKNIISTHLDINKEEKRHLDKIVIKGYSSFPKSFIKQVLNIKIGTPLSKARISQISRSIQPIAFASEIKKPELLFTKDSTTLYMYLKREKSNRFNGLIGFSTSPENKRLQLYGNIDLTILNAINHGESLQLKWLSTQDKSQSLELTLLTSYLFSSPFSVDYDFDIYKQDTTFLNISNHLNIHYRFFKNQKLGFDIENTDSNKTIKRANNEIVDFSNLFYGVSYEYIKPNHHPVFNQKIYLYSKVTQGKRNQFQQHRINISFLYLVNLSQTHKLVFRNKTELLLSKEYLENELYRIGGSNSIRGFEDRSLLATSYSYINTEYNYLLNDDSFLSALADFGILDNELHTTLLTTYSFGFGFSQRTKAGNLSIQYVFGNSNQNSFSFNKSKLHLKLSQSF